MVQASPSELVRDLLAPAVAQLGLQLVDVSWHPGKGRAVLRVTVDRPGGVTIDECGQASEAASALLDRQEELLPGPYSLEVSSPGAERDLASEQDFATALGRKVRLTLQDGESMTVVEGRLVALGPEGLDLEVRRSKGGRLRAWRVSRRSVAAARIVVDL
ncbi:MAG TPA: ribosome maturation factor RimP [Candidatus Dormibacteraeota bacterium]|nr:ribosome maturation factor RimP [Candidatus Dormibacteraeota bacterium]